MKSLKAHISTFETINQQSLRKWESESSSSSSWLRSSWAPGLFTLVRKKTSYVMNRLRIQVACRVAPAVRAVIVGLHALLLSVTTNNRIYVGLVLMGVVSPLSACVYMVFDRNVVIEGWYYVNYFHLFLTIGPSLFVFFLITGLFLLFPEGTKRSYALVIPSGFTVAKILWLLTVTSNEQFWQMPTGSFLFAGLVISLTLYIMLDWLAHRKFHGADSFEARLQTLYNGADLVDDAKFKSMFKQTMRARKEFKKQY